MASQTVTTSVDHDSASVSGLLNGEDYTINGGSVTVTGDVRWGQNAAVLGSVTISSTLGGLFHLNGTQVWEIAFDASSGNVPALAALGSNGVTGGTSGATGELFRVWAAGEIEPRAAAGAMPTTGWIKLRSKTGTFQDNETITLPGGATITVNSATGGKRSWIHVVGEDQGLITIPRLGELRATGDWYELGVTDGTDDQVIPLPFRDSLPGVWIETGAGTGVYEQWESAGLRWGTATQFIPTDKRGTYFGQWFTQGSMGSTIGSAVVTTTSTSNFAVGAPVIASAGWTNTDKLYVVAIDPGVSVTVSANATATGAQTFTSVRGDITLARRSSNACGYKPPTGCKIRIPNVIVSISIAGWSGQISVGTIGSRWQTLTTSAGVVNLDYVCGPSLYIDCSAAYTLDVKNTCVGRTINVANIATYCRLNNVIVGLESSREETPFNINTSLTEVTLTDCRATRYASSAATQYAIAVQDCANITLTRCYGGFFGSTTAITRGNSDARAIFVNRSATATMTDCVCVGGRLNLSQVSPVTVTGLKFADIMYGNTTSTNAQAAIDITNTASDIFIDGFETFAGLANLAPYSAVLTLGGSANGVEMRNVGTPAAPYDCGGFSANFVTGTAAQNITIRRVYCQNVRTKVVNLANSVQNVIYDNVWGDTADVQDIDALACTARGCRWTNDAGGQPAVYGSHWLDIFTSTTAGRIIVAANEPLPATASQVIATFGTGAGFTSTGSVAMPNLTDVVIWEMPYFALGHTSLANIAPTITGTNTGNFTLDFQWDTGSGYNGSWLALTGANLSGVGAINPATGVKLKVRATVNTANATNALTYIRIDTVTNSTDQQIQYPLPPDPTFTVTSNESGTLLQIFSTGTQTVLASTTGTTLDFVHAEQTVDIVAQKAGFLPQRVLGVVLAGFQTQAFTLAPDYNYDAAHGLTYTTSASWASNQLTVPSWGPSVRGVYSLMIDAFISQTALRNTAFNLSMNGPTTMFLINGAEGASDASITNMTGGGVRYLSGAGATTAEFVGILSSGVVAGSQVEYELGDGQPVADARATGDLNEIIKTYGDASHGSFDYRTYLELKVQRNGYRQAEISVIASYGLTTMEPTLYIIGMPMVEIAGLTLGDPGVTGLTLVKEAAPVSWDAGDGAKDYSLTITDSGTNSGTDILRWLNYNLALDTTFQGRDPFEWPECILDNGPAFETLRGVLHGASDGGRHTAP